MLRDVESGLGSQRSLHPAFFVGAWIFFSSITILFNKYLLSDLGFHFPAILTCWHLLFSSILTQVLARTTTLLDGRKTVKMTPRIYVRAIVPIGILYSGSLFASNQTYLYLSVSFIQMLKASAPFAVLVISWLFGVASPKLAVSLNVLFIVMGVALASYGEIEFVWVGFFYQAAGIFFEAVRLIMIQILLSGEGQKMDPLVSLYYYAPVCTLTNFLVAASLELHKFKMENLWRVGIPILLLNASVAFMLNVASVFLIGKTSGLVMTLCGVLKNILLVIASILIWGDVINGLQFSGYAIALVGLLYYGIGYDGIKAYSSYICTSALGVWKGGLNTTRWSPVSRRIIAIVIFIVVALLITGVLVRNRQAGYTMLKVLQDRIQGW